MTLDLAYDYARSGDVSIAYATFGEGPLDVLIVPGFISHLELFLEPPASRLSERLVKLARVITFDKRGTGLSDPVERAPTLDERMDDVRSVLDAAGSERAVLFGFSEGTALCMLFAATHPERTTALVLYGALARSTYADDHPWAVTADAAIEAGAEFIIPYWGTGASVEIFAPSLAEDQQARRWWAKLERMGASPAMLGQIFAMFLDVDVRRILPTISVPTLVLHRRGDRVVNVRSGRWVAEHIPGARYVELPGCDHTPIGDPDQILDEVEEFLTGVRPVKEPDRVLATVMFTDIVGSTEKAAELGDRRWRELLESHERRVRAELERFHGREIKTTGDGFLATFDGPARAIRCGQAIAHAVASMGLQARVGIHSGEIELRGPDVAGIAVHIASRVGSLAGSGEVLVSETVKGLVAGSGIAFEERGEHKLKGVPDEWRLFAANS